MAVAEGVGDSGRIRALPDDHQVPRDQLESYVVYLLNENREEIKIADSKTSIMFGAVAFVVGLLASALLDDESPIRTTGDAVIVIAVGALGLLMVALVLLALSITPRLGQPKPGKARYFEEMAQFPDFNAMLTVVAEDAADPVDRHAQQLFTLSRIAHRKYLHLRNAMFAVAAAMVTLGIAAVVGLFD